MRPKLTLAIVIAAVCAPAATAAVTIGPQLTAPSTVNKCGGGQSCTYFNGTIGNPLDRSPIDGVITSWRLQSGSGAGPVNLRVLRSASDGGVIAASSSQTEQTIVGVGTYATRQAIKTGEFVGVDNSNSALIFGPSLRGMTGTTPAAPNGEFALAVPTTSAANLELLVNATIELDTDRDGFGDETQDACPGDSTAQLAPCRPDWSFSGLLLSKKRVRRTATGTTVGARVTVNRASKVRLEVLALRPGRSVGGVCLPVEFAPNGTRCTFFVTVRDFTRTVGPGTVAVNFRTRGFLTGNYQVRAIATDTTGPLSRTRTRILQVVR